MKAYQCDRCHKFYNEKAAAYMERGDEKYKKVNIVFDTPLTYDPLDLCPDCCKSLVAWLACKEGA